MRWKVTCRLHWGGITLVPYCEKFSTESSVKLHWFRGRLRVCYCDSVYSIPHWMWERDYVVKKPQKKTASQTLKQIVDDCKTKGHPLQETPTLVEWLAASEWEDKTPRETSTLLLFVEDGRWKCCFTDRDAEKCVWITCDTLTGLLALLEGDLQDGSGEWREKKKWEPGKKKG